MNPLAYNSTPPYESAYASGRSAEGRYPPASTKAARAHSGLPWSQSLFLLASAFATAALLAFPVWNCVLILKSEPITYFIGDTETTWLLACLVFCWVGFVGFTVLVFDARSAKAKTWQSLTMISTAIFTLIAIVLMLFGRAIYVRAVSVGTELQQDCATSLGVARPLSRTAAQLYALRYQGSCADKLSVEQCEGFTWTRESQVLKAMETDYRCSTFCENPEAPEGTTPAGKSYPRTLFSTTSFKASCQMAMVRLLQNQVQDIAIQGYFMGCTFAVLAVFVSFAKIVGFCIPSRRGPAEEARLDMPLAQDVLEARDYGAAPRYVRDGVLY